MSQSRRKTPIFKHIGNSNKLSKRFCNRKFRKRTGLPSWKITPVLSGWMKSWPNVSFTETENSLSTLRKKNIWENKEVILTFEYLCRVMSYYETQKSVSKQPPPAPSSRRGIGYVIILTWRPGFKGLACPPPWGGGRREVNEMIFHSFPFRFTLFLYRTHVNLLLYNLSSRNKHRI